jgi:hypothetical protein
MGTADYLRRQRAAAPSDVHRHPERAPKLDRMRAGGVLPSGMLQWDQRNATEHNQGMVYLAALKIAEEIGSATLNVYDASWSKGQRGGFQVRKAFEPDDQAGEQARLKAVPDHPIAKLLKAPNPVDDQTQFLKKATHQYLLTGGCLIWDVRNSANKPIELYVIPRAWTQYQRPTSEYPLGWYRVTNNLGLMYGGWTAGLGATFPLDIRATVRWMDPHALHPGEPYSRLTACSEEIDLYFATVRKIVSGMRNGIKPGIVFKLVEGINLSDEQFRQFQSHLEAEFVGVDNAGRTLLTGPFEPVPLQPPEDGNTEARDQNRIQVQRTFGAPDAIFGALDVGTYSGIAAIMKTHGNATLRPICQMIAGALTRRFQPIHGDDFKVEMKPSDYDDPEMSLKRSGGSLFEGMKARAVYINEWRVSIGLPAKPEFEKLADPEPAAGGAPGQDAGGLDLGVDDAANAGGDADSDSVDLDLGVGDLGDDQTTGWKDRSKAGMPRPSFSLNGTGAG